MTDTMCVLFLHSLGGPAVKNCSQKDSSYWAHSCSLRDQPLTFTDHDRGSRASLRGGSRERKTMSVMRTGKEPQKTTLPSLQKIRSCSDRKARVSFEGATATAQDFLHSFTKQVFLSKPRVIAPACHPGLKAEIGD